MHGRDDQRDGRAVLIPDPEPSNERWRVVLGSVAPECRARREMPAQGRRAEGRRWLLARASELVK